MIAHIIAIRNLLKNKYRTLVSLGMIIGAVVALSVFRGYVVRTLEIIQSSIINGQFGHLQIAKKSYWTQDYSDKKETKINNYGELVAEIGSLPHVSAVSPRNKFYGLLSTDKVSDSALLIGMDIQKEPNFALGVMMIQGETFDISNRRIMIGSSLARRLRVKIDDDVTVVANTLDQVVNAMDFKVGGVFATGMEDFDSVAAFVDIKDAQKIMNSSAIDVLKISLTDVKYIDEFQNNVQTKLTEHGLQAKSWMEIASIFGKVKAFYNVQTGIMFSILVFIVLLGISNTVSMSLSERIGEIGTLRALGQSQWSLIRQFMLESIYLCVFAILIGIVLALVLVSIVNSSDIRTEIPGASLPVKVEVGFYWDVIAWVSLLLFVIVNIFTFVLVYRFVRIKIVEALRHNI